MCHSPPALVRFLAISVPLLLVMVFCSPVLEIIAYAEVASWAAGKSYVLITPLLSPFGLELFFCTTAACILEGSALKPRVPVSILWDWSNSVRHELHNIVRFSQLVCDFQEVDDSERDFSSCCPHFQRGHLVSFAPQQSRFGGPGSDSLRWGLLMELRRESVPSCPACVARQSLWLE